VLQYWCVGGEGVGEPIMGKYQLNVSLWWEIIHSFPLWNVAVPLYMPKSLHSFISSLVYIDFESLLVVDVVVIVVSQSMLAQRFYNCIPVLIHKLLV